MKTETNLSRRENDSKSTTSRIDRISRADIEEASEVLGKAFVGYPLADYMFEGVENETERRFGVMFRYLITARLVRGWPVFGAWLGNRIVGVAVVSEPGEEWSTPELDKLWNEATESMGKQAIERFLAYADRCDEGAPGGDYHYLGILGVLPQYQGNGYGRLLIDAVKKEADQSSASGGVLLNTESASNVAYYESVGFQIVDQRPIGRERTWAMLWSPNSIH